MWWEQALQQAPLLNFALIFLGFAMNLGAWRQLQKNQEQRVTAMAKEIRELRRYCGRLSARHRLARDREAKLAERVAACEAMAKSCQEHCHSDGG